ncbi:substrate-binding domain-containing protein [Microbacterium sp. NPDC091313]
MKIKKIAALGAVVGVVLAGVGLASSASAEPVSNSYAIVGSDTLQDSMNALSNGTNVSGSFVRILANGKSVGNFDAFGSAAIQTKENGVYFARPNGSGSGRDALRASVSGANWSVTNNATPARVIAGQVDIARSSSGAGTNASSDGRLLYVPYARDAVGYAYKGGTAAWANLTKAQLKAIYDGTLTSIDGVAVTPRLPQAGSGTRTFFLNALGYSGSAPTAPAVNDTGNTTPENDATVLGDNQIIPFSVANWVAQANNVSGVNTVAAAPSVQLGSPVAGQVPFTGTAPNLVPSAGFYADTTFGRDTYLIVERAKVQSSFTYTGAPAYDPVLAGLVDSTKTTSFTNFSTAPFAPGAVKRKFGFLAPSSTTPVSAYAAG